MSQSGDGKRPLDALDVHVGRLIREQRLAHGLSLLKAGEIIGLSQQQMSRVELGQTRIAVTQLYWLATAYRVSIDYFVSGYAAPEEELRRIRDVLGNRQAEWRSLTPDAQEDILLATLRALPEDVRAAFGQLVLTLRK